MKVRSSLWIPVFLFLFVFLSGCAGVPVREAVKEDRSLPVGKIEGKRFSGIRFPFKVTAPAGWEISTQYPKFMVDQGYHPEGLEESEVFIFNPVTQSNVQIDFTPAGRYATFDQAKMERMVAALSGEVQDEVKEHFGKEVKVEIGPTEPVSLQGVAYAAKKYSVYQVQNQKREQGWIYAFGEPYQIFILYIIMEKEGSRDRQDLQAILRSFEMTVPGAK